MPSNNKILLNQICDTPWKPQNNQLYRKKKKEEKNYEGEKIELIEGAWHCHLRVG